LLVSLSIESFFFEPGAEDGQGGRVVGALFAGKGAALLGCAQGVGGHHDRQLQLDFLLKAFGVDDELKSECFGQIKKGQYFLTHSFFYFKTKYFIFGQSECSLSVKIC